MNELIKVNTNPQGDPAVSGRELHSFLEVKTAYKDWFPRMCEYGFVEHLDFCSILSESTGGRPSVDHAMTLDMAKEISMLQRSAKGKQARMYFIEVEKRFRKLAPGNLIEALELALEKARENERLTLENKELSVKLDESMEWYTVKRVAFLNGIGSEDISWRRLKGTSGALEIGIKKVFDANYTSVNAYHIDVWRHEYPEFAYA